MSEADAAEPEADAAEPEADATEPEAEADAPVPTSAKPGATGADGASGAPPDEPTAPAGDAPGGDSDDDGPPPPGVGQAIGGARAAFMRMLDAHIALLRAELSIAGQELGIIVGLALGAFALAVLIGMLLYVGSFLFLGEWLFGSMGWGIIHGTLFGVALIGAIAINLAGGDVTQYGIGLVVGIIVTIVLVALLLTNVGNESAEWGRRFIEDVFDTDSLPFGEAWLVTLVGLVVGAVIGGVLALIVSWQTTFERPFAMLMTGLFFGGFVGAIYASTRYQAADGVLGLAIAIGLITWMAAGVALAARKGFDPEARYASLVPRESIAAFERTRDFLQEQWEKQKDRMMGR